MEPTKYPTKAEIERAAVMLRSGRAGRISYRDGLRIRGECSRSRGGPTNLRGQRPSRYESADRACRFGGDGENRSFRSGRNRPLGWPADSGRGR